MDLGLFRRSKTRFRIWIMTPVVLTGAVYYGCWSYCRQANASLEQQSAFLRMIPETQRNLDQAKRAAGAFAAQRAPGAENTEDLRVRLNEAAQGTSFTINSLSIEKAARADPSAISVMQVSLKGEGSMSAIAKYFNEVQGARSLAAVDLARLRVIRSVPEVVYRGEFVMRCPLVTR